MTHEEIILFIDTLRESHPRMEHIFMFGGCMHFYFLLKTLRPDAECYYDLHHVITKIDDRFYDITGEVEKESHIPFDDYYGEQRAKEAMHELLSCPLMI